SRGARGSISAAGSPSTSGMPAARIPENCLLPALISGKPGRKRTTTQITGMSAARAAAAASPSAPKKSSPTPKLSTITCCRSIRTSAEPGIDSVRELDALDHDVLARAVLRVARQLGDPVRDLHAVRHAAED